MLVAGFPSAVFGTNVYVISPAAGEECIVVDPGIDVANGVDDLLAQYHLKPVAVLLTHGHLDHTYSVMPVAGARGIPAYIHPDDAQMLADPLGGMGPQSRAMFGETLQWQEPDDVRPLADGVTMQLAGLQITVDHAPGHTPGSVMFRFAADDTIVSGDVLFAGSIGRTDLPGGSLEQMMQSLATKVLPLPDTMRVLPGHGELTTIATERASNPFLAQAASLHLEGR